MDTAHTSGMHDLLHGEEGALLHDAAAQPLSVQRGLRIED
eukprot:CAMPEP_0180657308 /NCGR_PEP_ID=MMETSP1037_2-20121125/56352_1 /TAXON_ID=632150 /ORGANISM="Azadinium spinosum, Strain 3D9" /LENGTH=39 /DNA_ID= /DNA_START= /DNA_END= /DNA_ORIENTATION=